MFKDYDKYLSTSLRVYIFVLMCVFIMKIVGIDYFGLAVDNPIMIKINNICTKFYLDYLYVFLVCYLTSYIIVSLTVEESTKKLKLFMLLIFPITVLIKYSGYFINQTLYMIVQILYLYIISIIYKRKIDKKITINYIMYNLIFMIIQNISSNLRSLEITTNTYNLIVSIIINLDYLIMLIIFHKIVIMKGGLLCHHYQTEEVGCSLLKKINLKKLLRKLQANLHKFRELPKQERLSISIYIFLSVIWNAFTIILIFLIAKLNDTFIECIFIVTSFWLSKHSFGKPFHLSSMVQCFIISNATYYILNRITTPLGISIFVPILLGVGLSYVTSKLVKKTYKPLYKGMPKDLFEETILKVADKNSIKYKICYDFYIKGKSDVALSFEYNYSLPGIRKIKNRINDNIRRLN